MVIPYQGEKGIDPVRFFVVGEETRRSHGKGSLGKIEGKNSMGVGDGGKEMDPNQHASVQ